MALYVKKKKMHKSDIDNFLDDFDTRPEAYSDSRRNEEEKYAKINHMRDHTDPDTQENEIWEFDK